MCESPIGCVKFEKKQFLFIISQNFGVILIRIIIFVACFCILLFPCEIPWDGINEVLPCEQRFHGEQLTPWSWDLGYPVVRSLRHM